MRITLKSPLALAVLILSSSFLQAQTGCLANLSSRLLCEKGAAVTVTEFILQGNGKETIVLRGLGPSLLGVEGTLRDPIGRLLDLRGRTLDENDN